MPEEFVLFIASYPGHGDAPEIIEDKTEQIAVLEDGIDDAQDLLLWLRDNLNEPLHLVRDALPRCGPIVWWWEAEGIVENGRFRRNIWRPTRRTYQV